MIPPFIAGRVFCKIDAIDLVLAANYNLLILKGIMIFYPSPFQNKVADPYTGDGKMTAASQNVKLERFEQF